MSHTRVRIEDKQFWITSTYDPSISSYGVLRKEGWCVYGHARYKICSFTKLEYALSVALSDLKMCIPQQGEGVGSFRIGGWFSGK